MDDLREGEAPFNMAIATLKRLDVILVHITNLSYIYPMDSATKQKAYISLVKQFYINAIPLMDEAEDEGMKKIKEDVLNFQVETKNNIRSGSQKRVFAFSPAKEKELDEILIDIQKKLKKYFMPKGKDPSKAVHFN